MNNDSYLLGSTQARDGVYFTNSNAPDAYSAAVILENTIVGNPLVSVPVLSDDEVVRQPQIDLSNDRQSIRELRDTKFRLRKPLTLVVRSIEDQYAVELPQVELYAIGDTPEEALREIEAEIADLYDELHRSSPSKLTPKTFGWKLFLDQYVVVADEQSNSRLPRG